MPAESVSYYCSEASSAIFFDDIIDNKIQTINLKECADFLLQFDIGFSCHSKQIFPASLVRKVRCINIHPGFNPFNRGWYPQVFSIINGLVTGVTIHEMDEDIDHGGIICQEKIDIYDWDTSLTVYQRIIEKELDLVANWLPRLIEEEYVTFSPDAEGNYNSRQDFKDLCKIDLDKVVTFREAINFLRAMTHPPYKNAYFVSGQEKIYVSLKIENVIVEDE